MRRDNIAMFQDTMEILNQGYYKIGDESRKLKLTREQMEAARVFLPEDIEAISREKDIRRVCVLGRCGYGCVNADSFSLARKRREQFSSGLERKDAKPILVLNLANPVNPGGGVRRGAKAQEEDLCRKSSLLLSLESENALPYYRFNRSLDTYMGSDAVMINPQVEIIKDEDGNLLEDTVIVAVMTCAAPMLKYGMEGMSRKEYESLMYKRITGMLQVAAYMGYQYLILGAFGCGAFRNDARLVSDLFYKALKEFNFHGMKEKTCSAGSILQSWIILPISIISKNSPVILPISIGMRIRRKSTGPLKKRRKQRFTWTRSAAVSMAALSEMRWDTLWSSCRREIFYLNTDPEESLRLKKIL